MVSQKTYKHIRKGH